ncbi:hypothetical protein, partial [Streptomyces boluensis]
GDARPAPRPSQAVKRTGQTEDRAKKEDRTRTVMDAVFGGLRAGCGPEDQATKEVAGQAA